MTRAREFVRGIPRRARAFIVVTFAVLAFTAWRGGSFCPFALLTGVPCPGCGLGRASIALVTGHPVDAFHFHPLVFVVLPALIGFAWSAPVVHRAAARTQRFATVAAGLLLVAAFGVWIARFEGAFGGPVKVSSARAMISPVLTR